MTYWINIYRNSFGPYCGGFFSSEAEAKRYASPDYVCTRSIDVPDVLVPVEGE
jgi:hypothetical protein